MLTDTEEGRDYVETVSRSIVREAAGDELEFFDELAAEYFKDPSPPRPRDPALGSGLGEGLAAVTPAAIAMASAVLSNLLGGATDAIRDDGGATIKQKLSELFRRQREDEGTKAAPAPLTQEQLKRVKTIAKREAKRFGIDDKTAKNMADALIGAIVLSLGT